MLSAQTVLCSLFSLCSSIALGVGCHCCTATGSSQCDFDVTPLDKQQRSHRLDNAKVLLTLFVVYGHFIFYNFRGVSIDGKTWLSGTINEHLSIIFMRLHNFAMPAFCFVSGVLSKGPTTSTRIRQFLQFLVVPTLLWVLLAKQFVLGFMQEPSLRTLMDAGKALLHGQSIEVRDFCWYLWVLILWRLSTFLLWSHLSPRITSLIVCALSCIAGYCEFPVKFLNEIFAFLPYFVAGYVFPFTRVCQRLTGWRRWRRYLLTFFSLTCVLLLQLKFWPAIFTDPLPNSYGSYSQGSGRAFKHAKGADYFLYWTRKLTSVAIDMLPVLTIVLALSPSGLTPLSWIGQYSIYPYLFHGIALQWREHLLVKFPPPIVTSMLGHAAVLLLHVFFALLVLAAFASWPWRGLFKCCFEPVWLNPILDTCFGPINMARESGGVSIVEPHDANRISIELSSFSNEASKSLALADTA